MTDHLNQLMDDRAHLIRALAATDSEPARMAISRAIQRLNDEIVALLRGRKAEAEGRAP